MVNGDGKTKATTDARRAIRQRAFLRAKLSYLDGAMSLDCVVTQISATGAKIDIGEAEVLPESFRISIPQKHIDRTARLVRRDVNTAAIAFVEDDEGPELSIRALRERLRVLEAENKMLRANCESLAAQLERLAAAY